MSPARSGRGHPGEAGGHGPDGPADPADVVGSVAQEAAKLFAVLSNRAREHTGGPDEPGHGARGHDLPPLGENCRWCPLCQAIGFVRGTSPEVRDQLVSSATAFVLALRELLDQAGRAPAERPAQDDRGARTSGVEHIDVRDEAGDEPWA